jgi:hypothetical protein
MSKTRSTSAFGPEEDRLVGVLQVPGLPVEVVLAEVAVRSPVPLGELLDEGDGTREENPAGGLHRLDDREAQERVGVVVDHLGQLEVQPPRRDRGVGRHPPVQVPGRPAEAIVDAERLPVLEQEG